MFAGDKVVDQHPMVPLQGHAGWLFGWLSRPPDSIPVPDVFKWWLHDIRCAQVLRGEEFRVSATTLPELATVAAKNIA